MHPVELTGADEIRHRAFKTVRGNLLRRPGSSGFVLAVASTTDGHAAGSDRFPSQARFIIGTEACERYSFYGMKGILSGYITGELMRGGLAQKSDTATEWIHLFIMLSYFTPLIGAWIADRFWGRYKTILWISLLYCVGHGVLAMADLVHPVPKLPAPLVELTDTARKAWEASASQAASGRATFLAVGLFLIGVGAGGIKPCVSAFMGDQFPEGRSRLYEKAFAAFYFSINFGSFFSFLTIPLVARKYGYAWAFGIPGILMGVATLVFFLGRRHYRRIPPARETRSAGFFAVLLEAIRQPGKGQGGFWDRALVSGRYSREEVAAAASVVPVLSVFALIPPFWAMFDQHSSTWLLQAKAMTSAEISLPGFDKPWVVTGEEMQSMNPLLVMILIPLLTVVVYPALGRLIRVTPLRKIGSGLFLVGLSYVMVAWVQQRIAGGEKLSVLWQTLPYVLLTTAEVLVSTTGLEFAYTQAARTMKSTITSFWLLTVTAGNALVVLITRYLGGETGAESVTPGRFLLYAGLSLVAAVLFIIVASLYRYRHVEDGRTSPT